MDYSSAWLRFVSESVPSVGAGDVWKSALEQLRVGSFEEGVVLFLCPNSGVKTVAQNKQRDLVGLASRAFGVDVRGVFFEIRPDKPTSKKTEVARGAPLLEYEPTLQDLARRSGLNPRLTLDNYAVSHCNNVAFAASQVVVNQVGKAYNPLFLWGGVGVGKTHLAQATAYRILQLNPSLRVFFCAGDKFTNEIIEAIRGRTTEKFRQKYRRLDVLVVDDIQFIAGKQTVQQEFFHTFNDVVERGGQIILISDRPPQQIGDLEDRLRSRFAGGLIIDISPPDFELKTAITLIKAKERGIDVDIEAAKKIAEQAEDNRMLEGILLSSYARALVTGHGEPTTTLQSRDVVLGGQNRSSSPPQIEQVLQTVCLYYQIKPLHLRQPNRTERVAHARHILMYILRIKLGLGLAEIARFLKRKDHTTILHGVQKIQESLLHNTEMRKEVVAICQNTGLSTDL